MLGVRCLPIGGRSFYHLCPVSDAPGILLKSQTITVTHTEGEPNRAQTSGYLDVIQCPQDWTYFLTHLESRSSRFLNYLCFLCPVLNWWYRCSLHACLSPSEAPPSALSQSVRTDVSESGGSATGAELSSL